MTHLPPESLAGYLDEDLPAEEQSEVERHLASCAECREELAEVRRLEDGRRRPWRLAFLPVAAAAALLAIMLPGPGAPPSDTRAGPAGDSGLEIASPGPVTFAWRSAGPGASYTFTLQQADGRVAWSTTAPDTVAVLPDSLRLPPGITWYWVVDALLADGRSRSTGLQRLEAR